MPARVRPMIVVDDGTTNACVRCGARAISVCEAIEESELGTLAAVAEHRAFEKGRIFITEGDKARDFFNVTAGTVKLFKLLADGRQHITGFAGPGYFLGLAAAESYGFSAEAIEPVRLCRFSRSSMTRLMQDLPALEARLLQTACNELVAAQEQMLLLGRKTARERVASFLLLRVEAATTCGHTPAEIRLPMTRGEIADHLGLTLETVSRALSRLRAEGLIRVPTPERVELRDRQKLEAIAGALDAHAAPFSRNA